MYGYFEDRVKFNADYNLQKFIKDKQKMREINKTKQLDMSESIVERIGESSSLNSKIPVHISRSGGSAVTKSRQKEKVLFNNFF